MADEELLDKVQNLSDLELAALLCLTAQEHCIIDTEPDALDELVLELQLVGDAMHSRLPSRCLTSPGCIQCLWTDPNRG